MRLWTWIRSDAAGNGLLWAMFAVVAVMIPSSVDSGIWVPLLGAAMGAGARPVWRWSRKRWAATTRGTGAPSDDRSD